MSLNPTQLRASAWPVLLVVLISFAGPVFADSFWKINGRPVSDVVTGAAPFRVMEAPSAEDQLPAELAQAPASPEGTDDAVVQVDETALRYFARQGDTRRLEREIARLRALYPQWTPPADPLSIPVHADEQLDAVWQLYSEGSLAEARQSIARRQADEPGWQPPQDLLDRLALSEARERLVNASEIDQHETVIRLGSENPHLLTCGDVDVLWRVAEAFARTDRPARASDAYSYILANCDDPQERLATIQNASQLLDQEQLDRLLAVERQDEGGLGEFDAVRDDISRNLVARGGEDETVMVPADQLARVERLANADDGAAEARLLGWYHLLRGNHAEAEKWFRLSRGRQDTADASEGLGLALMAQGQNAEAEDVLYRWRDADDDARQAYLAAAANLLGQEPKPVMTTEVLQRIVAEAAAGRDVATARQLGWYARAWEQHETAGQWFSTALEWDLDDEPSAYGLALTRHLLGDANGLAEIQQTWSGRSQRIQDVGTDAGRTAPAVMPTPQRQGASPPATTPAATQQPVRPVTETRQDAANASGGTSVSGGTTCAFRIHPAALSAAAALRRGWCLMDMNRPMEAIEAFDVVLKGGSDGQRRDAAWGKSLAYLRVELVDEAAVAAVAEPQDAGRANELQTAILAQRAAGAFERGNYVETLLALDQRSQIAPERIDLMVLRGYSYLNLNRFGDARRVFEAVAATGDREGVRGLAAVTSSSYENR
ncbi:cellulose synthase [Mesorhizobium sp. CAU 1741]|uniref:cellulose synthase n=1 Tax=Mesorhizobium sp. CAU 1741 TaxID=3140366 RepID=UPI00325B2F3B